jgi:hypothetical protein
VLSIESIKNKKQNPFALISPKKKKKKKKKKGVEKHEKKYIVQKFTCK